MTALAFNHVGVGVADLDAAVEWYGRVFGLELVLGPFEVVAESDPQTRDVLGPSVVRHRMAHMMTADGIGIELFQFIDPPHERREPTLEFWKSGTFHLCLTAPDLEEVTRRVVAAGGRQRSRVWLNRPPHPNKRMVYLEDPWGTILELYSHGYGEMYRPAAGGA